MTDKKENKTMQAVLVKKEIKKKKAGGEWTSLSVEYDSKIIPLSFGFDNSEKFRDLVENTIKEGDVLDIEYGTSEKDDKVKYWVNNLKVVPVSSGVATPQVSKDVVDEILDNVPTQDSAKNAPTETNNIIIRSQTARAVEIVDIYVKQNKERIHELDAIIKMVLSTKKELLNRFRE